MIWTNLSSNSCEILWIKKRRTFGLDWGVKSLLFQVIYSFKNMKISPFSYTIRMLSLPSLADNCSSILVVCIRWDRHVWPSRWWRVIASAHVRVVWGSDMLSLHIILMDMWVETHLTITEHRIRTRPAGDGCEERSTTWQHPGSNIGMTRQ